MGHRTFSFHQVIIYMGIVIMTCFLFRSLTPSQPEPLPITCPIHIPTLTTTWTHYSEYFHYFSPRSTRVTPLDHTLLVPGKDICKDDDVDMVILVVTSYEHEELRQMIRSTWGNNKSVNIGGAIRNIRVAFIFGLHHEDRWIAKVKQESDTYKDIVVYNFQESYYNLTYKVLLGLKWGQRNCPQAKFVLKVDDDTYLNLPEIFRRLKLKDWNRSICGLYSHSEKVERENNHSKVNVVSYPFVFYPPHVKGRTYFMPMQVARKLTKAAEYLPYVNIEDVHVTGILAKAAGNITHQAFKPKDYHPYAPASRCEILAGKVLISSTNVKMGKSLWKELQNGVKCSS